jgi:hypothetical protein
LSDITKDKVLKPTAAGRSGVAPFMIAANYFPFLYLLLGGWLVAMLGGSVLGGLGLAVVWIYLVPPLIGRIVLAVFGRPAGVVTPDTRTYKVWWFMTQLQMPFNRVLLLEELVRLVPGLYGAWLNLWGSRVNLFAYWSPGVVLTDRYTLHVGKAAVIGGRCAIGGHIVSREPDGDYLLTVADVIIGDRAIIGAQVAIGPGCEIGPDEVVPAGRFFGPFSGWKDGKRTAAGRHSRDGDGAGD